MKNEELQIGQAFEAHCTLPSHLVVRLIERALEAPAAAAAAPSTRLNTLRTSA